MLAIPLVSDPHTMMLRKVIGDAPFERVLGSVRFARGPVDGRAAGLILQAEPSDAPGGSPAFRPIWSVMITKHYCNAELAPSQVLSVALPLGYGGFNRNDGCFAS